MTGWNTKVPETTFFKIAFVFSIAMLLIIAYLTFKQLSDVNKAQQRVIRSRERQIETERLFSIVKDAERMQRGYIISGISGYFSSYQAAKNRSEQSFKRLEKLTNAQSLRLRDVAMLRIMVQKRFLLMDSILNLQNSEAANAYKKKLFDDGALQMLKIEKFINKIVEEENKILHKSQVYYKVKNNSLPIITGLLIAFATAIFFISFYQLNREAQKNKKINQELSIINKSFSYAEEIAQLGHWRRVPGKKNIIWSDNLYRIFGLKPNAKPITEKQLLNFVHPEDKKAVIETFKKVHTEKIPPNLSYRVLLHDGTTRYLKTIGRFVNIGSKFILLGTTCDITPQVEMYASLEQKNKELQAAVEELASFNHIASHDLQEPLRKIQMFISRILTEELETLSAPGKEYFERISISALRMEQLIDDLLVYSQTVKEEQFFEKTDLNVILAEALLELSAEIESKNTVIKAVPLPIIFGIPFQIRQLFVNLIGNAIKYSKEGTPPIISINALLVSSKDIPQRAQPDKEEYYKITVSDNGIGFKPEFAEKIFILFQRLHKKEHYSGTGIGLAICKKIIENHNGFIIAESTPGEGASFHVYFPCIPNT